MSDMLITGLVARRQAILDDIYVIHGRAKRLLTDVATLEAAIRVLEPETRLEAAREIDLVVKIRGKSPQRMTELCLRPVA